MWVIVLFELLILAAICIWFLHVVVAFKRTPWYALVTTWLGWLLCFSIVFLVPIDILDTDHENCISDSRQNWCVAQGLSKNCSTVTNSTLDNSTLPIFNITVDPSSSVDIPSSGFFEHNCTEPITYISETVMIIQWKVLWWGTMILSWLVFPLLSSYFLAGEFTTWEKVVRSIKENILIYAALGVLGVIGLIGLKFTSGLTGDAFMNFLLALANAYGLILTICLMGYGLVDIPRYMWRKANRTSTLQYYAVQAYKHKESIEIAKSDLLKTLKVVKALSEKANDHNPYRPYVDVVVSKCPNEYDEVSGDTEVELSYDKLVSVHKDIAADTHNVVRAVCLYEQMLKKAFKTEDVIRTQMHPQSDWRIYWSFFPARTHRFAKVVDAIEYIWEVYLFTTVFRVLAVLAGLLSLAIVWCELTLTANGDLSPFSRIINDLHMHGMAKQIYCLIIIFYMALCAYTTLFKLKLFNYYRLVPHQMSDANSIMFSANYLCRLAAPLSFNFLKLIKADDKSFTTVMGNMDAFPVLGEKFMIFFPVFVGLLCVATIFNVYSRIGAMCCIKSLRYKPDHDEKYIDEGEKILQDERESKDGIALQTTKQAIRSTVKEEVSKMARKGRDDEPVESVKVTPAPPAEPTTLSGIMAQKYSRTRDNDDLLPATSRFSNKRVSVSAAEATEMRHNLSGGNLASDGASTAVTGSSMRFNLSGNNLAGQRGRSTSTGTGNSSSGSTGSTTTGSGGSSLLPPTSRFANDDLLPPTSRFAKRSPTPTPAPPPAAILTPTPPADPAPSSKDTKSLLGGLFGKKNTFSLLPDPGSNV